ncbi:hypothetical protein F2P56_002155 [Juglans regia]|uniref:Reverse transcriptase domain-containing protein n=1 Tax=Juglans regia TaxID=51240 RepID=A0A833YBS9_JUGRE|nr:hypothetical protein F2P56_002155 [Juglans regia]
MAPRILCVTIDVSHVFVGSDEQPSGIGGLDKNQAGPPLVGLEHSTGNENSERRTFVESLQQPIPPPKFKLSVWCPEVGLPPEFCYTFWQGQIEVACRMVQRVNRGHDGKKHRKVDGNKEDAKTWKEVGRKSPAVVINHEEGIAKLNIETNPESMNKAESSKEDLENSRKQVYQGERAHVYNSDNEEGVIHAVMGKEKIYDSDVDHIMANGKSNPKEDKTLRKSQRNIRGLRNSRGRLKKLLIKFMVSLFAISEPFVDDNRMASLGNANQAAKLYVFWNNPNIFEVVLCTSQTVSGWFKWNAHRVIVTFVYAKCSYVDRRELWHDLEERTDMDQPWLVLGDFNVIRRDSERVGGNPRPLISMLEFSDCIDRCGLLEISSCGQNMSWCNGHGGVSRSWAKLDRVLMNNVFANLFPSVHFNYLSRKSSDHCPMVVFSDRPATSYGPSLFPFLNMWCLHDGFLMSVKEAWNEWDAASGLLKLSIHLKRTKLALRAWNKNLEDDFVATKIEIEIWEKREASHLGQTAKKKWLTEGDQNSKFFHLVIDQRSTKGHINKTVLVDGRVLYTAEEVHEEAVDIIKEDVVEVARDFFRGAPLSRFYSSSFIVLIPKVPEPFGFDKFHPISLCSVAYKIFLKIIVNRLNSILDSLVSHEQGAFIPRRNIFENITLAQDMVQLLHKKTIGGNVLIKLDMAKAYDRSQWFSVMMNGTFKYFFQSARGLHQGDPLSPYLFILMEEVLTRLLRNNFAEGRVGEFSHPIGAPLVSHLLYVDDILVFANGGKRSMKNLMHTLDIYERWSSQEISMDKSALFLSKLISTSRKRSLLSLTGFKECKFLVTYLGVPLVSGRLTTRIFEPLIDQVRKKLPVRSLNCYRRVVD